MAGDAQGSIVILFYGCFEAKALSLKSICINKKQNENEPLLMGPCKAETPSGRRMHN